MEILWQGKAEFLEITCPECKSVLGVYKEDLVLGSKPKDSDCLCAVCGKKIIISTCDIPVEWFKKEPPSYIYEITKSFKGGSNKYYALLPKSSKISNEEMEYQLEEWGECTNGGHSEGYEIRAKKVKKMPENAKRLFFNENLLTRGKEK